MPCRVSKYGWDGALDSVWGSHLLYSRTVLLSACESQKVKMRLPSELLRYMYRFDISQISDYRLIKFENLRGIKGTMV
jgi:hypothetical protein